MLYVIHAYDQMYAGYHGIEHWCIEECDNDKEAIEIATELSLDIIQSYSIIYEEIDQNIEECITDDMSEDEIEEFYNDAYNEDIDYNIWVIKEDIVKDYDIESLENMLYRDPEDFIEKYCNK